MIQDVLQCQLEDLESEVQKLRKHITVIEDQLHEKVQEISGTEAQLLSSRRRELELERSLAEATETSRKAREESENWQKQSSELRGRVETLKVENRVKDDKITHLEVEGRIKNNQLADLQVWTRISKRMLISKSFISVSTGSTSIEKGFTTFDLRIGRRGRVAISLPVQKEEDWMLPQLCHLCEELSHYSRGSRRHPRLVCRVAS